MKKALAEITDLGAQLEKLREAIEVARRWRKPQAGPVRSRRRRPGRGAERERVRETLGFVEFSGAQLMDAPGTVVELADATGVKLTIRLAGGQPLDVAALVTLFRGAL